MASEYELRLMEENDYDEVFRLLHDSFFLEEPLNRCMQVTNTYNFAKNTIDGCLQDRCSFIAVDKSCGKIVGVCLNQIEEKNHDKTLEESDPKLRFILEIFDSMHKNQTIFDRLNLNRLLHVFIINVHPNARGYSLASKLIRQSITSAKELNLDGAYAEATNLYSLHCFSKERFEIIDELIYLDYNPELLSTLIGTHYDRCYLVARKFCIDDDNEK